MSNHSIYPNNVTTKPSHADYNLNKTFRSIEANQALPFSITKVASKQTYYTIRFLGDRDRVLNAYRAYAYFRWVDDWLDEIATIKSERLAFIERQQRLVDCSFQHEWISDLSAEEHMLVALIQSDQDQYSGLQSYIRNMMAVMAFDANRRDRLISQSELAEYSRCLSTAVTDALHYFIGHDDPAPPSQARYYAVTGAHITHMLRDTFEDIAVGYYNISREFLEAHKISARDVDTAAYREWVRSRVQLARECFEVGKGYITQVKNLRCRIAGYAYTARFEIVLDLIERDNYQLRSDYSERKSFSSGMKMSWMLFSMLINGFRRGTT